MLTTLSFSEDRITTAHRAKLLYVYVRQSSPGQVRHHQESTEQQYRLVERAVLLGWPRERIHVIDDDLGKSGTSSSDRYGFQRLIAEVGLGLAPGRAFGPEGEGWLRWCYAAEWKKIESGIERLSRFLSS